MRPERPSLWWLQEMGFFDATPVGEITSRLSADCSTVCDQISLNLNVLARSLMQATTVLAFMLVASWRLTVVTMILVPANIQVCGLQSQQRLRSPTVQLLGKVPHDVRWCCRCRITVLNAASIVQVCSVYGRYYQRLSKELQTALAAANTVADESLANIATVRTHAAGGAARAAYHAELATYYAISVKASIAYGVYVSITTFLPQAVAAIVLLYGGALVLRGDLSRGGLVSFMLYQQSLAATCDTLGSVFSALMAAVGAAAEVVRLLRRAPCAPPAGALTPPALLGHVQLHNVRFEYPSRPEVCGLPMLRPALASAPQDIGTDGLKTSMLRLYSRCKPRLRGCID